MEVDGQANADPAVPASRIIMTDLKSPGLDTPAGKVLGENMNRLRSLGLYQMWPTQNIDGFDIPRELTKESAIIFAGSPACQDVDGNRTTHARFKNFKENMFYSICFQTREKNIAVMMTYSRSGNGRLEFWTDPQDGRVTLWTKAQ